MTIAPQKLGWLAAIIDLKGKVIFKNNKQRATRQIVLMVESKEVAIIKAIGDMTGTNPEYLTERRTPDFVRRGCIEHCPEKHIHALRLEQGETNFPPLARWTITGAGAAIILHNVAPHLVVNHDYYAIMVEILTNAPTYGQGSGAVNRTIRRLASLGWELPDKYQILEGVNDGER